MKVSVRLASENQMVSYHPAGTYYSGSFSESHRASASKNRGPNQYSFWTAALLKGADNFDSPSKKR